MLAKLHGCRVTASASRKNETFVRELGAHEVCSLDYFTLCLSEFSRQFIDYTKEPLHKALSRSPLSTKYHVFFDAVGLSDPSLYTHSLAYLAPGGIFISSGPVPKDLSSGEITNAFSTIWNAFLKPRWLGGIDRYYKQVPQQFYEVDINIDVTVTRVIALSHNKKDLSTLRDLFETRKKFYIASTCMTEPFCQQTRTH
jgi:NADPH:quinone reductase-like Zn-dependent oxidoreductase